MEIDKFFIVNALLLAGLVAGAGYLQNTYSTDKPQGGEVATHNAAVPGDSGGWHVSTTTPAQTTPAPAVISAPKKTVAPTRAPKPSIRGGYDDDGGDEY